MCHNYHKNKLNAFFLNAKKNEFNTYFIMTFIKEMILIKNTEIRITKSTKWPVILWPNEI